VTSPVGPVTGELLDAARAAARAASELLATARPAATRSKSSPRDLVTEWDLRSEELIRRVLEERVPGVPVLGEEGGQGAGSSRMRWLVDPIDGTVNFAHGLPIWSVSIGLEDAGELEVGVVAAPRLGWWFEASRGGGARARGDRGARDDDGEPLAVSAVAPLDRAMLATGFPYDVATRADNNLARWAHLRDGGQPDAELQHHNPTAHAQWTQLRDIVHSFFAGRPVDCHRQRRSDSQGVGCRHRPANARTRRAQRCG